jgi:hypothetical protein
MERDGGSQASAASFLHFWARATSSMAWAAAKPCWSGAADSLAWARAGGLPGLSAALPVLAERGVMQDRVARRRALRAQCHVNGEQLLCATR